MLSARSAGAIKALQHRRYPAFSARSAGVPLGLESHTAIPKDTARAESSHSYRSDEPRSAYTTPARPFRGSSPGVKRTLGSSFVPTRQFHTGSLAHSNQSDILMAHGSFVQYSSERTHIISGRGRPFTTVSALSLERTINSPRSLHFAFFSTEPSLQSKEGGTNAVVPPVSAASRPTAMSSAIPRRLGTTPVPTPLSAPQPENNPLQTLKNTTPKTVIRKGLDLVTSAGRTIVSFTIKLPGNMFFYATHPAETRAAWIRFRDMVKAEADHYWVGTKLLWADIITARKLFNKTLEGSALTRRERKQMLRTVSDLFRLIPFSMFVIVPFMEFALPFALRLFPNMLPSTYQDSLKHEENMKRELKSRIAMAQFFQETLEELAKEQKRKASKRKKELEDAGVDLLKEGDTTIEAQNDSAGSMLEFLKKARNGEMIPPDIIIRYANYFKDDLTLDNMPRMQLINMCKYMSIQPYGSDSFLRFQLRHKIRVLKEDDQRILWDGIESLTKMELREACQERGMRSTGLSKDAYRRALQQWLDLSVNKDLPIALLIMSRTFFLREEMFQQDPSDESKSLTGLADAISGLDKEILNEVILEVATTEEKRSDPDVRKIKLEVLSQQNELIREEEEAREAAAKLAGAEKAKSEKLATLEEPVTTQLDAPGVQQSDAVVSGSKIVADSAPTSVVEKKDDRKLSTEEMEALSHLISDDPVCKERMELERIKAAMKTDEKPKTTGPQPAASPTDLLTEAKDGSPAQLMSSIDNMVRSSIQKTEDAAAAEADAATSISFDGHVGAVPIQPTTAEQPKVMAPLEEEDEVEDPVIARLKKKVESMVGKIEVQLSETQIKIGDKLHLLDKDRDGILSREEMAVALQQVLKREISLDEAMAIANEMDNNQDGVFTIDELIQWINEHKLLKLVKEGHDADLDRIMEKQTAPSAAPQKQDEAPTDEKLEKKD